MLPRPRNLKNILRELHVILACDKEYQNLLSNVPIIGFKNIKKFKAVLRNSCFLDIGEMGMFKPYKGKRPPCQLCSSMKDTESFKSKHFEKVPRITKQFDCSSNIYKENNKNYFKAMYSDLHFKIHYQSPLSLS